jgi:ribosomal protein S4
MAEEEHEKKKKKWKTFNYLQKQLKLKKEKKIFIPVMDVTECAAPGPCEIETSLDSEE